MHSYSKKLTAQLLLFSLLLESCYNPNIGIGKRALPTPEDPAYKQRQYEEQPHDKYPQKLTTHTFTTADNYPVRFTFHNGQWQAEVKEYAANGSWQRRQLPVIFGPGLALEDLVDSNPTEQSKLLYIYPNKDNTDHTGYVYVGRVPIQAKPHPQLLSSPAARQIAPRREVGLAQQQATAQPKQVVKSTQEQPGREAVLALTSPWQQTGRDGQLPPPPARVISKPLPTPSSELSSHQFAQNKSISEQKELNKKILSLRKQNKLQHSQQAAQTKRQRAAEVSELPQPAQHSQAIIPLLPILPIATQSPTRVDQGNLTPSPSQNRT